MKVKKLFVNNDFVSIFHSLESKELLSNVNVEKNSSGYRRLTKQAIRLQNQRTSNIRGLEYGKNKLSKQNGRRLKKFKQKEKYFTA